LIVAGNGRSGAGFHPRPSGAHQDRAVGPTTPGRSRSVVSSRRNADWTGRESRLEEKTSAAYGVAGRLDCRRARRALPSSNFPEAFHRSGGLWEKSEAWHAPFERSALGFWRPEGASGAGAVSASGSDSGAGSASASGSGAGAAAVDRGRNGRRMPTPTLIRTPSLTPSRSRTLNSIPGLRERIEIGR